MRTKRIQRRRRTVPAPKGTPGYVLPDPFSALNPDLVQDEVNLEGWCPCCLDRAAQLQEDRDLEAYLADADDKARDFWEWQREEFEARYDEIYWPKCGRFCFCSDCCEARACSGFDDEYDDYRRAFPSLPWDEHDAGAW